MLSAPHHKANARSLSKSTRRTERLRRIGSWRSGRQRAWRVQSGSQRHRMVFRNRGDTTINPRATVCIRTRAHLRVDVCRSFCVYVYVVLLRFVGIPIVSPLPFPLQPCSKPVTSRTRRQIHDPAQAPRTFHITSA